MAYPTDKLNKAFAHRAFTSNSKPSWRELASRYPTIPAGKALQAPDVLQGFSGSWASMFGVDNGIKDGTSPQSPSPLQQRMNRLGQPGMAEIDFRPYDFGTTRGGAYGPSLLGHPISFSVVGPTLKHSTTDWQWILDDTGAQDRLYLDSLSVLSTPGTPVALSADRNSTGKIYGFDGATMPVGGVYLVVSATGAPGQVDDGVGGVLDGGLGDGIFGDDGIPPGGNPREPVVPLGLDSKFEIFRVVGVDTTNNPDDTLVLDSGKRIGDFFTVSDSSVTTPIIRAVMLLTPAATRVVAMPGAANNNAAGAETSFAVLPPIRALNADLQPTFYEWDFLGGFDPQLDYGTYGGGSDVGDSDHYSQSPPLPIPVAIEKGLCRVQGIDGEVPVITQMGTTRFVLDDTAPFSASNVGRLLKVGAIRVQQNGQLVSAATLGVGGEASLARLQGYWEIVDSGVDAGPLGDKNYYQVRFLSQIDVDTGQPFYGHSAFFQQEFGAAAGDEIWMDFTVHEPVWTLWRSSYLPPTQLEAARLSNLIDPDWVQPTTKGRTDAAIGHPSRPDRAIFNTRSSGAGADGTNEDPGSMLDLGFRVVLFPAKDGGALLIPDFDNPIDSNELVLDPSVNAPQFYEVDYSSGMVHLSHPPVPGAGCTLMPDATLLNHADNPRGEVVFFVSCVPFSQEPGQKGVSPRVTAGASTGRAGNFCGIDNVAYQDAYGRRKGWRLAAGQTVASGVQQDILLDVQLSPADLSPQGFVDLVQGDMDPSGTPILHLNRRHSTWGYSAVTYSDAGNGGNTTLNGCFGGGAHGVTSVQPTATEPWTAYLRRNIQMPNNLQGQHGTDFQFDTTYGYAKRSTALRFRHGLVTPEHDGSLTVDVLDPRVQSHRDLFADLFSSWVISGGENQTAFPSGNAGTLRISELTVLIEGVRSVLPEQDVTVGLVVGDEFLYVDGSNPSCPAYATATQLPLPSSSDVLIGRYTHDTVDVLTFTDLRQPMVDLDKRLDVTVGQPTGHAQPSAAHFSTLADAVEFVRVTSHLYAGSYRRIKIIGPTEEDISKLPIAPAISGVIIEGAGRHVGTVGAPQEVVWKGAAPALFDLADCSHWIIRDVHFRYDEDGSGADATPQNRCLFINSAGLSTDMLFENITLSGPAHGFFYSSGIVALSGLARCQFRRCQATELTDFAVAIGGTASTDGVSLDECSFVARKIGGASTPELGLTNFGVIHFGSTASKRTRVSNCQISGGDIGVLVSGGDDHVIHGNYITNTDNAGIYYDADLVRITQNYLDDVHTEAAGVATVFATAKVGIGQAPAANQGFISHNYITLSGYVQGDRQIYVTSNSQNTSIIANTGTGRIDGGRESLVMHNDLILDEIVCEDLCVVLGNRVGDLATGDFQVGDDCVVEGNYVAGSLVGAGTKCRFSNNWFSGDGPHTTGINNSHTGDIFGDPDAPGTDGLVNLVSGVRLHNCYLGQGFSDGGAAREDVQLVGCEIDFDTSITVDIDHMVVEGCRFNGENGDQFIWFQGVDVRFHGNSLDDSGITVRFDESLTTPRTEYSIIGNRIAANGVSNIGGFWVVGHYCVVANNIIEGVESESGTPDFFSLSVTGDNNVISGNVCSDALNFNGSDSEVVFNRADQLFAASGGGGDENILQGNRIGTTGSVLTNFSVSGDRHLISNNFVGGAMFVSDGNLDIVVEGNLITNNLTVASDISTVAGNYIEGDLIIGNNTGSTVQHINGNHVIGDVGWYLAGTCFLLDSVFSNNIVGGDVNLNGDADNAGFDNCSVVGNTVKGTFNAEYSERTTFTGNRFQNTVTLNNGKELVFQGNYVGSNSGAAVSLSMTATDDYVIVGNHITGALTVDGGAGAANTGVIVGNRAGSIATGLAAPANNQVTVANKVDNGANVYAAGPGTATANVNNVED